MSRRRVDPAPLWSLSDKREYHTPAGLIELRDLYVAELGGDKLLQADLEDAVIFTGALTFRLIQDHFWAEAERELLRFMAHPDIADLDYRGRCSFDAGLGFCALSLGREAEGLRRLNALLTSPDPDIRWQAKHEIRDAMGWGPHGHCPVLWRDGIASEPMTTFVEALVARLRHLPSRRRRFPRRTSFAKLRRALLNTMGGIPPGKPDRVKQTEEEILREAREGCEEALREIRAGFDPRKPLFRLPRVRRRKATRPLRRRR